MSELYLALHRRLELVVGWRELGSDVMRDARKALGLSAETMGRKLNVSSKTWDRWERAGRVPEPMVSKVADVLELEIVVSESRRVVLDEPESDRQLAPLLEELGAEVSRLRHLNDELEAELVPARPGRKRRG